MPRKERCCRLSSRGKLTLNYVSSLSSSFTCIKYVQVTSRKDQGQYWYNSEVPYRYITVDEFTKKFKASHIGEEQGLLDKKTPKTSGAYHYNKNLPSKYNKNKYSMTKGELFKACMDREVLLTRRNISSNIVKSTQVTCFYLELIRNLQDNIFHMWIASLFLNVISPVAASRSCMHSNDNIYTYTNGC